MPNLETSIRLLLLLLGRGWDNVRMGIFKHGYYLASVSIDGATDGVST